jgi:hypothetical protein
MSRLSTTTAAAVGVDGAHSAFARLRSSDGRIDCWIRRTAIDLGRGTTSVDTKVALVRSWGLELWEGDASFKDARIVFFRTARSLPPSQPCSRPLPRRAVFPARSPLQPAPAMAWRRPDGAGDEILTLSNPSHFPSQGDNQGISRQHARIAWNPDAAAWELSVQGKNGVAVDGAQVAAGAEPVRLRSGAALVIGDRKLTWHGPAPGWPVLTGEGDVVVHEAAVED